MAALAPDEITPAHSRYLRATLTVMANLLILRDGHYARSAFLTVFIPCYRMWHRYREAVGSRWAAAIAPFMDAGCASAYSEAASATITIDPAIVRRFIGAVNEIKDVADRMRWSDQKPAKVITHQTVDGVKADIHEYHKVRDRWWWAVRAYRAIEYDAATMRAIHEHAAVPLAFSALTDLECTVQDAADRLIVGFKLLEPALPSHRQDRLTDLRDKLLAPVMNSEFAIAFDEYCHPRKEAGDKIVELLRRVADDRATAEPPDSTVNLTGEAKALALLAQNPDWTNTEIAAAVPCSRTTLNAWPRFVAARKAQRAGAAPPSGRKDKTGYIEALDE